MSDTNSENSTCYYTAYAISWWIVPLLLKEAEAKNQYDLQYMSKSYILKSYTEDKSGFRIKFPIKFSLVCITMENDYRFFFFPSCSVILELLILG